MFKRQELIFEIEMRIFSLEYRMARIRKKMLESSKQIPAPRLTNFVRQITTAQVTMDKLFEALEAVNNGELLCKIILPAQRGDLPKMIAGLPFYTIRNGFHDKESYCFLAKAKYYFRTVIYHVDDGIEYATIKYAGPYTRHQHAAGTVTKRHRKSINGYLVCSITVVKVSEHREKIFDFTRNRSELCLSSSNVGYMYRKYF